MSRYSRGQKGPFPPLLLLFLLRQFNFLLRTAARYNTKIYPYYSVQPLEFNYDYYEHHDAQRIQEKEHVNISRTKEPLVEKVLIQKLIPLSHRFISSNFLRSHSGCRSPARFIYSGFLRRYSRCRSPRSGGVQALLYGNSPEILREENGSHLLRCSYSPSTGGLMSCAGRAAIFSF